MRRAAGDVAGKTIAAQIRQAARHLGYAPDDWRVREAWYGRAGDWSAVAVDDLRTRFDGLRRTKHAETTASTLARRLRTVRDSLTELQRQFDELEDDFARSFTGEP